MQKRELGNSGLEVSALGLGCMSMSSGYGPAADKGEMIKLIRNAHDRVVTHFDTAEAYGPFVNEELAGEALQPIRDKVTIATKFGFDTVRFTPEEIHELNTELTRTPVHGERLPAMVLSLSGVEAPAKQK